MNNLTENEQEVISLLHETWKAYLQTKPNVTLMFEFMSRMKVCQEIVGKQALARLPVFLIPDEDK